MTSFDQTVFQRLFGVASTDGPRMGRKHRPAHGGLWASRLRHKYSPFSASISGRDGWAWSEHIAPFGVADVRVRHHVLGTSAEGGVPTCPVSGWGMVIAGSVILEIRQRTDSAIRCEVLHAGDVWSVPDSAMAWFHCSQGKTAHIVALIGGREPDAPGGYAHGDFMEHQGEGSGFHYGLLAQQAEQTAWGRLRVVEADAFCDPNALSAALIEIDPGCRTDLHWHLNTSVWQICLDGAGQVARLPSGRVEHRSGLRPGTVMHVPRAEGYFIRNEGEKPLRLLEIFRSDHYHDLSLSQWLAACPVEDIAAHLRIDIHAVRNLVKLETEASDQGLSFGSGHAMPESGKPHSDNGVAFLL